jgi:hypothetical protein
METTHLETLLSLLLKHTDKLENIEYEIQNRDFNYNKYIEPCIKEFKKNLINKDKEGKIAIVKYYIFEIEPYTQKVWFSLNLYEIKDVQIFKRRSYNNRVYVLLRPLIDELDFTCNTFDIDFKEQVYSCKTNFTQFDKLGTKPFRTKIFEDSSKNVSLPEYVSKTKKTPPEPIEPEILDNYGFSVKQRFYLLVKTGLLETEMFKGSEISQGAKHKLLAKILSCDVRTAKGMFNNEISYQMSIDNQKEIEKLYNKITKNKDL